MRKLLIGAGIYLCATAAALFGCGKYENTHVYLRNQPKSVHYLRKPIPQRSVWAIDTDGDRKVDEAIAITFSFNEPPPSINHLVDELNKGINVKLWKHYFVSGFPEKDRAIVTDNSEEMSKEMQKTLDKLFGN